MDKHLCPCGLYMDRRSLELILLIFLLVSLSLVVDRIGATGIAKMQSTSESASSEDPFGEVDITVSAYQNLTLDLQGDSIDLGNYSRIINPTDLTIDVVNDVEPLRRFNSDFNLTLLRGTNYQNGMLESTASGLNLSFGTRSQSDASILVYQLTFTNRTRISESDFVSIAISTGVNYTSTQGYIGISLLLRDDVGVVHYISIHVSDLFSKDGNYSSKFFLGYKWPSETENPLYEVMYRSLNGPWFVQLPLRDAFLSLNINSAWLEGLLVGAELWSPTLPYDITQAGVMFHYALVHPESFSINQYPVNSVMVVTSSTSFLNISGINVNRLNATLRGSLRPSMEKAEEREGNTVKAIEAFYNFSEIFMYNNSDPQASEIRFEGKMNITIEAKTVRECIVTINNETMVDLTDPLLRSNQVLHRFPSSARIFEVFITLYKYNSFLFEAAYQSVVGIMKKGISEEYFIQDEGGSVTVDLNATTLQQPSIAIRAGGFHSCDIWINSIQTPLISLLVLHGDVFFVTSIQTEENVSLYAIRYTLSSGPLYSSFTVEPFNVFIDTALFEIFTPFNLEGYLGIAMPITVRISTFKTYVLNIEYDSSIFEIGSDELMVNKRKNFEYFILDPVHPGLSVVNVHFIDPDTQNIVISIPFLINITYSLTYQIVPYMFVAVTLVSLTLLVGGKDLLNSISSRFKRRKQFSIKS